MSSRCSIGSINGYHFYYDVNDFVEGGEVGKTDYWVWIDKPNYECMRVMPLSVWQKMVIEDCNGYIKALRRE